MLMAELEIDDDRAAFDGYEDGAGPDEERIHELETEIQRLRTAAKLQSELVTAVAHELRTPLSSLLGFTEILLTRDLEPATRDRYLRIVAAEARRWGHLLEDLLDVELLVPGASRLELETFDVGEVVAQQADLFGEASDKHALVAALPPEPLLVHADRDRITQVVVNLVSNAIKYSPTGGVVVIAAERTDGRVRVSVRDNGVGIPAEHQHLVFARFFRSDAARMRGTDGLGLGLALSREIVKSHGGSVGFESAENKGSTFWFELRSTAAHEESPL